VVDTLNFGCQILTVRHVLIQLPLVHLLLVRLLHIEHIDPLVNVIHLVIWNGTCPPHDRPLGQSRHALIQFFTPPTLFGSQTAWLYPMELVTHLFIHVVVHTIILHRVVHIFKVIDSVLLVLCLFKQAGGNALVPEVILHRVVYLVGLGTEVLADNDAVVVLGPVLPLDLADADTLLRCILAEGAEGVGHAVVVFHEVGVPAGVVGHWVAQLVGTGVVVLHGLHAAACDCGVNQFDRELVGLRRVGLVILT